MACRVDLLLLLADGGGDFDDDLLVMMSDLNWEWWAVMMSGEILPSRIWSPTIAGYLCCYLCCCWPNWAGASLRPGGLSDGGRFGTAAILKMYARPRPSLAQLMDFLHRTSSWVHNHNCMFVHKSINQSITDSYTLLLWHWGRTG